MRMFIGSSFVIAPNWRQLKCSSTTEWIKTKQEVWSDHKNGILLNKKKEETTVKYSKMEKSVMHYAKWKRPDSEG